jgi:hypothetical protein
MQAPTKMSTGVSNFSHGRLKLIDQHAEQAKGGKGKGKAHGRARGQGKEEQPAEALQLPLPLPSDEETSTMAGAFPSHHPFPSASHGRTGPTDWSFWVLKGRVLAGAYPKRQHLVADLLKAGLDPLAPVFSCCRRRR